MTNPSSFEVLTGLAVVAATGLSYFILFRKSRDPNSAETYKLKLRCKCGKVEGDLVVPPSSRYSKQINIHCCCNGCVGFAKHVQAKRDDKSSEVVGSAFTSVHMVQFYKSDLTITKGLDLIVPCQMREGSYTYRYYSSCCKTPLFFQPVSQFLPVVAIYRNLLEPNNVYGKSNLVVFASSLPDNEKIPEDMEVHSNLPFRFYLKFFGRVGYGRWYGKSSPNCLNGIDHSKLEIVKNE